MSSIYHRMAVHSPYSDTTQGTAMCIRGNYCAPEALIASGGTIDFILRRSFLGNLSRILIQETLAVQERFMIHGTLLNHQASYLWSKISLDKNGT